MSFIITFIFTSLTIFKWIIILQVIFSFLNVKPDNSFGVFMRDILRPLYSIIQKLPHKFGIFDFTPLIALILIDLLHYFIKVNLGHFVLIPLS